MKWNQARFENKYNRILDEAKDDKYHFTDEELESPYLDKLSHHTKSHRIMRMVTLAYYLGQLRAVRKIDSGYSEVVLSEVLRSKMGPVEGDDMR